MTRLIHHTEGRAKSVSRFAAGLQHCHVDRRVLVSNGLEKIVSKIMLTLDQKTKAKRGFKRGYQDTHIAKLVDASHMSIYQFRVSLGISRDEVLNNRYDTWVKMLSSGQQIEQVAAMYQVKVISVQKALWLHRKFSFVDAKRLQKEKQSLPASSWSVSKLFK